MGGKERRNPWERVGTSGKDAPTSADRSGNDVVNRSKVKGTAAETAVVTTLVEEGWPHVERRALKGALDRGDVAGIPGVMVEVKAEARYDLPGYLREVEAERAHDNADVGVAWVKLRGKTDPRKWAVLMTGEQFIEILRKLGY